MSGQGQGQPIGHGWNAAPAFGQKPEAEKKGELGRPNPTPNFNPLHVPPVGGRGIGSSDLDPLGRFGPGNILDQRGNRNRGPPILPNGPGAIPPGARFDPFSPLPPQRFPPNGFGNPDHDHQRPQGGFGDM